MSNQTAYPLAWPVGWPRTKFPARSRFGTYYNKPSVAKARDLLTAELSRMGVTRVVLSTNIELRRDGLPYSNQKDPKDSGVAVYFTLNGKSVVLACDKWNTVGDNIWAIAKHIEALRGQDRWGVGSIDQAFTGYLALNEKTQASCWEVLGITAQASEGEIMAAYRSKSKTTHPDAGGSIGAWNELNAAKDIALATVRNRNAR